MAKDKKKEQEDAAFGQENIEEKESNASKMVSLLIVSVIVLIWLGIFIVLIKCDVGGFGSKILRPVLKDVPIVNAILPDEAESKIADDNNYKYKSLKEAINRIKELELQIDSLKSSGGADSNYISDLEAEIKRLKVFEEEQKEFAQRKLEFDKEVVFADNAPSLQEYMKYYESIDPDNAAEIYRQVVEQVQYDSKVKEEAERYANMEPAKAAAALDIMTAGDLDMVCAILSTMKPAQASLIMQEFDANVAARITKRMLAKK